MEFNNSEDFSRRLSYPGRVLFIDGLTGTGKTIFIKLVNSTSNSYAASFNYALEQLCVSNHLGKISSDATEALIKLNLDQFRFDFNISREINLRTKDLSSIWRSKDKINYFFNLFNDGNDDSQLYESPKFLTFVVHQLLHSTQAVSGIYEHNFYQIFCTRHPAYLYYHWKSYVMNHGTNPRDITLHKLVNNQEIPWFIEENKNYFQEMNAADKAAVSVAELTNSSLDHINANKNNKNFVVVDFENFVLHPVGYIEKLENWFDVDSKYLLKVLKKENIPRKHINQGVKKGIYLRYESGKLTTFESHRSNYQNLISSIKSEVSSMAWHKFSQSIDKYEDSFSRWY
jgi:hypothetical protein